MDDTLGSGFQQIGLTADGSTLTWTATGLTTGGSFYFKVSAVNEIGDGALSLSSSKIVAALVPSQPATPTLVSQSPTAISISWVAPNNGGSSITAYLV
jgi:hypothetical protein